MNSRRHFHPFAVAVACVGLLLTGCWQDRLVWSPDGSRLAIITKEGLHLCDPDGKLTPLLAPSAYRVAWLGDSQRLVLARSREIKDWKTLAATLGPDRMKALAAKAEVSWQLWQANGIGEASGFESDHDLGAIVVYLREHHGAALRAKIAENEPKELEGMTAQWHSLVVARVSGDRLEFDETLNEGLAEIHDIRPSPSQPAVAFVTGVADRQFIKIQPDSLYIYLAPLDTPAPAVLVASHTAVNPDWTPDGRTLVYLQAASSYSSKNTLTLGALVERRVLDDSGRIQLADKTRDLAGLIFQSENRVRCLRDGRVLFDAAEFRLPLAGKDRPTREQLFALDRTKDDAPLIPLIHADHHERVPDIITPFEVSPDEKQVLIHAGAAVDLLTLATGTTERLSLSIFNNQSDHNPPRAVWRRPGELTYLKIGDPRNELILRRGDTETILSRNWPDNVWEQLIK